MRVDGSSTKDGINNNTYKTLFDDSHIVNVDMVASLPEASTLMQYTLIKNEDDFINLVEYQRIKEYAEEFLTGDININRTNGNTHHYKSAEYEFDFRFLSSITDDEEMINELFSKNRYGKCHTGSIEMCLAIPDSYLITGYANDGENRLIHSVCTYINDEGIEMCIDYTRNLIMPYEIYKKMNKYRELNRIESSKVSNDMKEQPWLFDAKNMSLKVYCLFRDDIVADITKTR